MLKDNVSIDVQAFFDNNNNNFILKEIGFVFEKDPHLKNSFLIFIPVTRRVKGYTRFVGKYVTGRRKQITELSFFIAEQDSL